MGAAAKEYPLQYFLASGCSATINYPLWRASAVSQSGFVVPTTTLLHQRLKLPNFAATYIHALSPPYKGAIATVVGMTWARAAIFYGSDAGRDYLQDRCGYSVSVATVVPPLITSVLVQILNQPLVRATITIQNPSASHLPTVWSAIKHIANVHGIPSLWHGTSAGILKTVPKYCTAIVVKDIMESQLPLPQVDDVNASTYQQQVLMRSAIKSATAGIAGAALTNPVDVIRNEMFKTNRSLFATIQDLIRNEKNWMWRGLGKNMVAVAIPVACTIFFTDAFIQYSKNREHDNQHEERSHQYRR